MNRTIEERFWSKVDKSGDCWEWKGYRQKFGYGVFHIDAKRSPKTVLAHRMAYTLTHGAIQGDLCVLHKCDNPSCVRPDHLFLGTQLENIQDRTRKGRSFRPLGDMNPMRRYPDRRPRLSGERNSQAKIDARTVQAIRDRYAAGGVTQRELASEHGITQSQVSLIVLRKVWNV